VRIRRALEVSCGSHRRAERAVSGRDHRASARGPRPAEPIIARHGEAWCNVEQTIGGLNSWRGLTRPDNNKAALLAGRLAAKHLAPAQRIAAFYTRPLERTHQTASLIQQSIFCFRPSDGWRWTLHRHKDSSHIAGPEL
jgi:hypothetical protein